MVSNIYKMMLSEIRINSVCMQIVGFLKELTCIPRLLIKNGDNIEALHKRQHDRCKSEKQPIYLELYYDTTVEPFESTAFDPVKVLDLLTKAQSAGFQVKIIDTAGWSREMLMEQYKGLKAPRGKKNNVFGPPRKRGWFFGREVPALIVYFTREGVMGIYPRHEDGHIVTVEDFLNQLLGLGAVQK